MGSGPSYVPTEVLVRFKDNPDMREFLETYGNLRKHEPGHAELIYLFEMILVWKRRAVLLEKQLNDQRLYTANLELRAAGLKAE